MVHENLVEYLPIEHSKVAGLISYDHPFPSPSPFHRVIELLIQVSIISEGLNADRRTYAKIVVTVLEGIESG